MAMYWTCKYGSNHDCGERCDCEEEKARERERERERMERLYAKEPKTNQLTFNWNKVGA